MIYLAGTDFSHLTNDELIKGIKALDLPDYIRSKAYGIDVRETLAQMTEMTIQLGVNMGLSPDEALKWARKLQESVSQSEFDSWVATLLDGGPSLFFETKAALVAKYPNGAAGVALVRETDPARIYVWNGTAWEDFGAYQGIEIKDGAITSRKIANNTITADKVGFVEVGKNLFNKDDVEQGYLSKNGSVNSNTTTSTSGYIKVSAGEVLHRTEYVNQLAFYNGDFTLNSFLGYNTQTNGVITVPDNASYLRVTVSNSWLDNYQIEYGDKRTTYEPYSVWFKSVPISVIGSDSLGDLSVLERHLVHKEAKLIFGGSEQLLVIDFIKNTITIPAQTYLSTNFGVTSIPAQVIDISEYTRDTYKLCVHRLTKEITILKSSIDPSDTNEYSLLSFYYPGSSVASINPYLAVRRNGIRTRNIIDETASTNSSKPYAGKKIVFYGDSITNSPARLQLIADSLGFNSHLNLGWSDSAVTMEDKLAWVNPTTGVFMGNPAAGGQQPSGSVAVQSSFCHDDRIAYMPTDADLIFIMGGTNDLFRNKPLGDLTTDNATFTGALIETIKKIQIKVPNALIVVATPIVAINGAGSESPKSNYGGLTILDYVKKVEEVVEYTGVAFSDVHQCGINLFNAKNILPDGTHPSTPKGTELLSRKIVGDLKAIAPL